MIDNERIKAIVKLRNYDTMEELNNLQKLDYIKCVSYLSVDAQVKRYKEAKENIEKYKSLIEFNEKLINSLSNEVKLLGEIE